MCFFETQVSLIIYFEIEGIRKTKTECFWIYKSVSTLYTAAVIENSHPVLFICRSHAYMLAQGVSGTVCPSTLPPDRRHKAQLQGPASASTWANAHCVVGDEI